MKKRQYVSYHLRGETWEHPERFNSFEEAQEAAKTQYRERNKEDGHDEYWQNVPLKIVIKTQTDIIEVPPRNQTEQS